MPERVQAILPTFEGITLDALKKKAELLQRLDNKYVLSTNDIVAFMEYAQAHFQILDIHGLRQFRYSSAYFDSPEYATFRDHNQGRRQRLKVRHREYMDHQRHYFEVKLKGLRGITKKFRTKIEPADIGPEGPNAHLIEFFNTTLHEFGYPPWPHPLTHSITVFYERITLVAKEGDQRITIDNRIRYSDATQTLPLNDDRWVVEVKSKTGLTHEDRWMFRHGRRPVKQCSKYSMGINLMKKPSVNNRFSAVIRREF